MRHFIPLALLLALSACGTRGALYMPPGTPPPPLLGKPAPQQPTAKTQEQTAPAQGSADLNTPQDPQK